MKPNRRHFLQTAALASGACSTLSILGAEASGRKYRTAPRSRVTGARA